ncbi:MAG: hypothetical protein IPP98_14995 [Gemmatimonadetes bacterium]|nr:hypothetical protein [Gemmatimonadota bacterium]MBL0180402.1 hypothetical protein [Gemmatimonadota bacterium]
MGKPLFGLILGGILGIFDGLTALVSAPAVAPQIMMIVVGSMGKGLVAGWIIGFIAKKVDNMAVGIVAGTFVSGLLALPFALGKNPETGEVYFWEILIPGMIVGLIVGYATQRHQPKGRAA